MRFRKKTNTQIGWKIGIRRIFTGVSCKVLTQCDVIESVWKLKQNPLKTEKIDLGINIDNFRITVWKHIWNKTGDVMKWYLSSSDRDGEYTSVKKGTGLGQVLDVGRLTTLVN